jgi:hypothetical protein
VGVVAIAAGGAVSLGSANAPNCSSSSSVEHGYTPGSLRYQLADSVLTDGWDPFDEAIDEMLAGDYRQVNQVRVWGCV